MTRKRNLPMYLSPEVRHDGLGRVYIKTGAHVGTTQYTMQGELSIYCTTKLIRDLRRALHEIRDQHKRRLDEQIALAEGPTS